LATSKNHHAVMAGERVAVLLRTIYPAHRAKLIARDFEVSIPVAERWLAGKLPTSRHLAVMAVLWSHRFIEVVFPEAVAAHDRKRGVDGDKPGVPTWAGDAGRRPMMMRLLAHLCRLFSTRGHADSAVGWRLALAV
jgi:hypothetical protein